VSPRIRIRSRARSRLVFLAAWVLAGCGPPVLPNIVLISLDTTRADHLGVYGYAGGTSPNLDRFAERAVVYDRAYATSSWTLPTHASMFTGLLPMEHGAQSVPKGANRSLGYGVRPLDESFATLAELLGNAGYRTAAVVGGPALRRELGLAQGFQVYDDQLKSLRERVKGRRAEDVADAAIALVEQFGNDPWFLFVNFFDPHAPYDPPAPYNRGLSDPDEIDDRGVLIEQLIAGAPPRRVSQYSDGQREWIRRMRAGYDAEIRYMDLHLGRLLDAVAASPRGDATVIAITADHGESFGEHFYVSHGAHLYEHNVRVPLLIRTPDTKTAARAEAPVQNHRLFGELLSAAGVPVPGGVDGRDLATATGDIVLEVQRSDLNVRMFGAFFDRDLVAIQAWPHKLVVDTAGRSELFDLEKDPEELHDLAAEEPKLVRSLDAKLRATVESRPARYPEASRAELRPETEDALRALGYIE
jgi:arylsulfatase A-like enzyme